jgi:ribosomal protein S19E (S16A)
VISLTSASERELRLLYALQLMCEQYIGEQHDGRTVLDHMWMGAGEEAFKALEAYGLIDVSGRGATWTEDGLRLLDRRYNQQAFPE